jgi:hypothetical protein
MTDPEWKVDVVGDETNVIWTGPGLPAAEAYWLAIRANPDDLANTMPDEAFLALVDMVRKRGEFDAVVADRDALCDFVAAHDAAEHLIAGGVADDLPALRQQYERWAAEPVADDGADLLVEVAAALGWPTPEEVGEHRRLDPTGPDSDSAAVERLREARAEIDPIIRARDVLLGDDQTLVPVGDHGEALTPGADVEDTSRPALDLDDDFGW